MKGTSAAFEMQVQYLKAMYEEKIPFNKILGFKVESLQGSNVVAIENGLRRRIKRPSSIEIEEQPAVIIA